MKQERLQVKKPIISNVEIWLMEKVITVNIKRIYRIYNGTSHNKTRGIRSNVDINGVR